MFAKKYGDYTVGEVKRLNRKYKIKSYIKKIDWEPVIVYGVALGYIISQLYLMIFITAYLTK